MLSVHNKHSSYTMATTDPPPVDTVSDPGAPDVSPKQTQPDTTPPQEVATGELSHEVATVELSQEVMAVELSQEVATGELSQEVAAGELSQEVVTVELSQEIDAGEVSQEIAAGEVSQEGATGDMSHEVASGELSQDEIPSPAPAVSPAAPKEDSPEPKPEETVVSKRLKTDPPLVVPPSSQEVVFQPDWAPNSNRKVVIDRIRGCIYGNALGDAMGLATEFMSKADAAKCYKKPGPIQFSDIAQDFHRYRWQQGDWTDDTDQMLLIMEGITESGGKVVPSDFAKKLYNWAHKGFPELGDFGGLGIGMTVNRTITHKNFLADPHAAAREVWESSGKYLAANGAVMRTSVLGLVSFNCLETVVRNTLDISLTTHADPRCSASCVAVTTLISQLLQSSFPCTKEELSTLVNKSIQVGADLIEEEEKKEEFISHMKQKSFQDLKLDEPKCIGYTLKCAGSAFVGVNSKVKNAKDFLKLMTELVREAGDADTNGAVCGAVIGCKIGYSNLPHDWLQKMPHIKWLDAKVEHFLNCIGLSAGDEEISAV